VPGRDEALRFVRRHLADVVLESADEIVGSARFRGGQTAADAALATYDVGGYAARRNNVLPASRRGASQLSPYIRHGLLPLRRVWDHVADGPARDRRKFRDELLWQEYARHWYARLGSATRAPTRRRLDVTAAQNPPPQTWQSDDRRLACIDATVDELHQHGWLVNQTRMWLASHWTVRLGRDWVDGEDEFFRHLIDGSRAANRLGWQWTTGTGSNKPYGFSRWQVDKRAPELCRRCPLHDQCPIENWPDTPPSADVPKPRERPDFIGPSEPITSSDTAPDTVWMTAESLGNDDPAAAAHPDLPVVFVFDEPLLRQLRLSSKRLVFLVETLAKLGVDRDLTLHLGRPADVLADRLLAVTHAPVPGFATRAAALEVAERHPWPWLVSPGHGSIRSFSAWRRGHPEPR
jgi:deoxyribodipyrimidine photo-lyase